MSALDNAGDQMLRSHVLAAIDEQLVGVRDGDDLPAIIEKGDNTTQAGMRSGLKILKPIHLRIIEYHLRGYNHTEVADMLSCSMAMVHYTLKDPLSQPYLFQHEELSRLEFHALRRKANKAVSNGLDSADEKTGLQAAKLFYEVVGDKDGDKKTTAEDVVAAIINQVNVQINNYSNNSNSGDDDER